jgi:hypothetical protein
MSHQPSFAERPARPSQQAPPGVGPPPRPTWLDFILILAGCSLSLLLTDLSGFQARETAATPLAAAQLALRPLPYMLFLPLGILLLWPLFYMVQRLGGRRQALSSGEWLWGFAWLAAVLLTGWIAWQYWGTPPEQLRPEHFKGHVFVGYAVGVLSMGALALLIGLVNLVGRWQQPWTHSFCLALLMWPALPLGALLLWGIELK